MNRSEDERPDQTLADYTAVVRRNIWAILIIAIVVPVSAYFVSSHQTKVFSASSKVLLSRQDLGSALTGVQTADYSDADRFAQTQTQIARTPEVARQAIKRAGVTGMYPSDLLDTSSVSPASNADLLVFSVTNGTPVIATRLATAYAEAFAANKFEMSTATLRRALTELGTRITRLRNQGLTSSQEYRDLVSQAQKLRTIELLQAKPTVVKRANVAVQIAPTPKRNAVLGAVLGLMLGVGVAFLWNAFDKHVRTEEEVERTLGMPLLARLPRPNREARADRLQMLEHPAATAAESVRRLMTNLELANLDGDAKVIMVTSAAPFEGKSTTLANLAVAFARSGHRVALVDLDLRRPALGTFFDLKGRAGITDVTLGRVRLDAALVPIDLPVEPSSEAHQASSRLFVLPSGSVPANPGEFVGSASVANVLRELRRDYDFVLVDAPPLLGIGDAMTLSTRIDAIFVVVRLGVANRPMLRDLARGLKACPAEKLGFVITDVDERKIYGNKDYGYYTNTAVPEAPTPLRRVTSSER